MDQQTTTNRVGVTVRLDPETRDRLQRIATFEHRSIAGYLEMLIERDLHARDEAERVVHVFTAPELQGEPLGMLEREADESDERHANRTEALRILLGGH